jgi:ubiquinol-cytochrome c reductase iron-sulfur subunit
MRASRVAVILFALSMVASVVLVGVYVAGGSRPAEGVLLGLALGGLGGGIIAWTRLIQGPVETEEREPLESDQRVDPGEVEDVTRRKVLVRLIAGAGGALAAALAIPTLSLGPTPGDSLYRTSWRRGARVVDENNRPIKPSDIPLEGVETVFPEGAVGSGDSQALLLRVDPDLLQLGGRARWAPEGCVVYSKICTHAGCPVGLYRAEAHELLCPCHQSTFDVLRGAKPVFGPTARALPQLPLAIDDEGYLVAEGDFTEPVGPSFWNVHR